MAPHLAPRDGTPADAPEAGRTDGRRSAAAARRRVREAEIIKATRQLFDERGVRDAQIEDIARAVGINRAIVYRHFTGKEEIFALVLIDYLEELRAALLEADDATAAATERLGAVVGAFVEYGVARPAFVDCAHALMRRRGPELFDEISESAMLRLGRAMTGAMAPLHQVFADGARTGELRVEDPALLANLFYGTGLGALQLAHVGLTVTESAPGVPTVGTITPEQVRDHLVRTAVALARA
ncbi:MAG: TetR/AcrR family transcriptional regulator [Nocardioides sp.]